MPDGDHNDPDSSDVQREAVVEIANLTDGMMGGMFDQRRDSSQVDGSSRSRSTPILRVRAVSGKAAIILAVMTVASPVITGVTVGLRWGVTVGLGVAAAAAAIVFVSSHVVQRRTVREGADQDARP